MKHSFIPLTAMLATMFSTLTESKATTLRVFQFNIWQEGTSVPGGFDNMIDLIIESKADVVALSEVRNYNNKDLHQRIVEIDNEGRRRLSWPDIGYRFKRSR